MTSNEVYDMLKYWMVKVESRNMWSSEHKNQATVCFITKMFVQEVQNVHVR